MHTNATSASAYYEEQKELSKKEEAARKEREFDKRASLELIRQHEEQINLLQQQNAMLKTQNSQLEKQYNESKIELKKSKRQNLIMLIATVASTLIAAASFIVAILQ